MSCSASIRCTCASRDRFATGHMRERPGGSLEDWVELAYADVPPRMWPVAKRSLLAHVQRIEALQLAGQG